MFCGAKVQRIFELCKSSTKKLPKFAYKSKEKPKNKKARKKSPCGGSFFCLRCVAARRQNLGTIAADQAAFVAQKDQPDGKKTFVAYLWMVCGQAYDQQNP